MKIAVLGCGRWGTFLAWYADQLGWDVTLWGRHQSENMKRLQETRSNEYLTLPASVALSNDLKGTVRDADFIIISIGAQQLKGFLQQIRSELPNVTNQTYILCMKGIEASTGQRLSERFQQEMGAQPVAVWAGPGHVQSFVQGVPNCMVVDAADMEIQERVIQTFGSDLIRFYYGTDLIGTEVGAATKNVIGIAAGMLDGLGLTALKGALMARAPREIARLIVAMGGKEHSAYSLAHLGDYEATLFSLHSHNRQFGEDWVKGVPFTRLAEGVQTLEALEKLGARYDVDLPICQCIRRVVHEGAQPQEQLDSLFARPLKPEFL